MIKPPSNLRKYEAFFSGDPAIIQLPEEATEEQIAERQRRLKLARETGRIDDVLVPGETPTLFSMRPLPTEAYGLLANMIVSGETPFRVWALAFRTALLDVKNLPEGVKVDFAPHPDFGLIATTDFLDKAGCGGKLGARILVELGQLAYERAGASPN